MLKFQKEILDKINKLEVNRLLLWPPRRPGKSISSTIIKTVSDKLHGTNPKGIIFNEYMYEEKAK